MKINKDNYGALALLGIIVLFLSSCIVNRKGELTEKGKNFIATYCKGEDSTSTTDRITILFDTVRIPYPVEGPVQYLENPCKELCDSLGRLKAFSITKKTNGITGTVKSVGNSIAFECKTDSLLYIIETQKRIINTFESNKTVIQAPCNLEHVSGTKWAFIRIAQWFLIFLGVQILIKILISVYPVTRPFIGWAYLFKF
jgi:hypothetical protein